MIEILVGIAAIVLIAVAGKKGAKAGFFVSIVTLLVGVFAMVVALRFWFPVSLWLAGKSATTPDDMAFAAFWGLFGLVFAPPFGLLRSLNERVIPAYPVAVDRVCGFLAGCLLGAILASSLATSLLPFLPNLVPGYQSSRLILPVDRAAIAVYRGIQAKATGLNCSRDEVIVFPQLSRGEDGKLTSVWQ